MPFIAKQLFFMEYIVRGSKNENDSKFKLTLERVCRSRSKRRIVSTNSLQNKFKFTINDFFNLE